MIFFPLTVALIILVYIFLFFKQKDCDRKMRGNLTFRYSVCLVFAIVEYLYLKGKGPGVSFWIVFSIDALTAILMGNDILKILKRRELTDEDLPQIMRLSGYVLLLSFGLVLMAII